MRERLIQLARRYPLTRPWVPYLEEDRDWTGAKNFFLSLFLLSIALVLALNGAAAFDARQMRPAAIYHTLALAITAYVTVKLVPALARGTPLRWLFYQVDYRFTSGGVSYFVAAIVIGLAAYNTGNNLLFLIFSSMMAGILISAVVSRTVLTGVDLELELPEHVFARQPILASLTLENLKMTLPSFSVLSLCRRRHRGERTSRQEKQETALEEGGREGTTAGAHPAGLLPLHSPLPPRHPAGGADLSPPGPLPAGRLSTQQQVSFRFPAEDSQAGCQERAGGLPGR
jgi:hypothetical protein